MVITEGTLASCCGHAKAQARAYLLQLAAYLLQQANPVNPVARALIELTEVQSVSKVCPRYFFIAKTPPAPVRASRLIKVMFDT